MTKGLLFKRKPRVLNMRTCSAVERRAAVRIDRETKWGNPKVVGRDGTREEVIRWYEFEYLPSRPDLLEALHELAGKDVLCHCNPLACHGDVLIRLANTAGDTP